jgi:hypothetical protein
VKEQCNIWLPAEWLESLTAKANFATVLVLIPASSDTVESGDPTENNNYRPISLFSSFGRILEKNVVNKQKNFMENTKS